MKYINHKSTFVNNGKWICYKAQAKIIGRDSENVKLIIKDSGDVILREELFSEYFIESGVITPEDDYEFNQIKEIDKRYINNIIKNYFPNNLKSLISQAIDKAYQDAFTAPGDQKTITISAYNEFLNNPRNIHSLQIVGSPYFNRRPRWAPIANEEDWANHGKPAPIGIRGVDYATFRECNLIFKELIRQVFTMYNVPRIPEVVNRLRVEMGIDTTNSSHICSYCGKPVDIYSFNEQDYGSTEHALNFCHRDPTETLGRTNHLNIYFGHTKCNRIQGGLSEKERIEDGLRLLILHENQYITINEIRHKLNELFKKINK
jgi:hypothetical protein